MQEPKLDKIPKDSVLSDPRVAKALGKLMRAAAARVPETSENLPPAHQSKWLSTRARIGFRVTAIAVCASIVGLGLPDSQTQPLDYWIPMAAFLLAVLVAAWQE